MQRAAASLVMGAIVAMTAPASAAPPPPNYRVVERPNTALVATGGVLTGVSVVSFAVIGYQMAVTRNHEGQCLSDGGGCMGGGPLFSPVPLLTGIFTGIIGVPMLVIGLTSTRKAFEPLEQAKGPPRLAVLPTFGGVALAGSF